MDDNNFNDNGLNDNNFNNREKHEATKKKLKTIGFVLLAVGGVFSLIGFINFFSAFFGGGMPTLFWCLFIGLPLFGIGGSITATAHKREISRYMKNESVPVANEASEELSPAIRNIASAIKDGLHGENDNETVVCPACGAKTDKNNKFCGNCGAAIAKVCPACGKSVPSGNAYCGNCGAKL